MTKNHASIFLEFNSVFSGIARLVFLWMIVAAFIEIIMAVNVKAENDTKSIFGSNANISTGERVYSSDKSISIFAPKGWIVDSNPAQKGVKLFIQSPKENSNDKFQELVYINEDFLPNT